MTQAGLDHPSAVIPPLKEELSGSANPDSKKDPNEKSREPDKGSHLVFAKSELLFDPEISVAICTNQGLEGVFSHWLGCNFANDRSARAWTQTEIDTGRGLVGSEEWQEF